MEQGRWELRWSGAALAASFSLAEEMAVGCGDGVWWDILRGQPRNPPLLPSLSQAQMLLPILLSMPQRRPRGGHGQCSLFIAEQTKALRGQRAHSFEQGMSNSCPCSGVQLKERHPQEALPVPPAALVSLGTGQHSH